MPSATLVKPPPLDPSKSAIENTLELTELASIGPDIYTNTRPLWHPPGARGIFGGSVIAQSLSAAQKTIPAPRGAANGQEAAAAAASFLPHSMHCYFVLAGDAAIPVLYHVERVREGKSFMTRTVQARQRGRCIFTTTASFVREGSGGARAVAHHWPLPDGVVDVLEARRARGPLGEDEMIVAASREEEEKDGSGPFVSRRIGIHNADSPHPHHKQTRQWIKARGAIAPSAGLEPHLSALAYMSDSYFIGTISRVHNLWRFGKPNASSSSSSSPTGPSPATTSLAQTTTTSSSTPLPPSSSSSSSSTATHPAHHPMAVLEQRENSHVPHTAETSIGMMVSLDHTIYFHAPRAVRADDWLFSEMESPWAGDGRGLVLQRIWNREGVLVASCVQEGLVRLKQEPEAGRSRL